MTPDEIAQWKAEQQKRPLAERLGDVAGHRVEADAPSAEVGWDGKQLFDSKDGTDAN
jgi:hypothetical protein